MKRIGVLLTFAFCLLGFIRTHASHLRAGEITVERTSIVSRQVKIIITVYTNTASDVLFGLDGILSFGDGTSMVVPETQNQSVNLGPNIGKAVFTVYHNYPAVSSYVISYVEPNRNGGVLNMDNSFYTTFYLETKIDMSVLGPNQSPKLLIPPIDQACSGIKFFHNPGAYDPDLIDSLSYELVVPFRDRALSVVNYRAPNSRVFYDDIFLKEDGSGPPTFAIDPIDGTLTWDAAGREGEYNIAFHIIEWRKINGIWRQIGYVRRDMQIIVNAVCNNERPTLEIPEDICVVAGTSIHEEITGLDPDGHKVKVEAFSEVFEFAKDSAYYYPVPPAPPMPTQQNPNPIDPAYLDVPTTTDFYWNTTCNNIKGQPYNVVFKITDDPRPSGVRLVTEATWQITVVAPAPVADTAIVQSPQRFVNLTWEPYGCSEADIVDENSRIQIWRRVDETNYTITECDTGMPESLGYVLIGTVPITSTSYLDRNNNLGLDRGVKYCYRIVAVFGSRGAESYVSNEVCIKPMPVEAPLITQVTVDKTGESDGEITVSWIPPINPLGDLDTYRYELQRAEGGTYLAVTPKMDDATLSFKDGSLNTFNEQYVYRVMLYEEDDLTTPIDSSSNASSVWLNLIGETGRITLNWEANVPWSNQVDGLSHQIYRYVGSQPSYNLADLTLYQTVNPLQNGLRYTDGVSVPLDTTLFYCYMVKTFGSYGNPDVPVLPGNNSQINCTKATDPIEPCAPQITAFLDPCDNYFGEYNCRSADFTSVVKWSVPGGVCKEDIRGYYVYKASNSGSANYLPIYDTINGQIVKKLFTDTVAVIENLFSLANCYRIQSVDRSGNVSAMSDPVCSENCPNYELPNVFTPNGDNCNDFFSAYGVPFEVEETPVSGDCLVPNDDLDPRCARFVARVDFKVFNRWGRQIYEYVGQRGNENSIYINWNGLDNQGKEVATGIYYYSADVTFDSTKPGGTVKNIKGWVHLIR